MRYTDIPHLNEIARPAAVLFLLFSPVSCGIDDPATASKTPFEIGELTRPALIRTDVLPGTTENLVCTREALHADLRVSEDPRACYGPWRYEDYRHPREYLDEDVVLTKPGTCERRRRSNGSSYWHCTPSVPVNTMSECERELRRAQQQLINAYPDIHWENYGSAPNTQPGGTWTARVEPHPDDPPSAIETSNRIAIICAISIAYYQTGEQIALYAQTQDHLPPTSPGRTFTCSTCDALGYTVDRIPSGATVPEMDPEGTADCILTNLDELDSNFSTIEAHPTYSGWTPGILRGRRGMIRQLMKLYEFHAHELRAGQIDRIFQLYIEELPFVRPTETSAALGDLQQYECGATLDDRSSNCLALDRARLNLIEYCGRLMSPTVPPEVRGAPGVMTPCLELTELFTGEVDTSSCDPDRLAQILDQTEEIFEVATAGVVPSYREALRQLSARRAPEDEFIDETQGLIQQLMRWYRFETITATSAESLDRALEDKLAAVWSAVYEERRVDSELWGLLCPPVDPVPGQEETPPVGGCRPEEMRSYETIGWDNFSQALESVFRTSFAADRMMFRAAVRDDGTGRPTAQGDLLLALVGQSLAGLANRLDAMSPSHDLACAFLGCGPNAVAGAAPAPITTHSILWETLAALDDENGLQAAVPGLGAHVQTLTGQAGSPQLLVEAQDLDEWRAAFDEAALLPGEVSERLRTYLEVPWQRSLRRVASSTATYTPGEIEDIESYALPPAIRRFADVVARGRARTRLFREGGGLFPPVMEVRTRLHREAREQVLDGLTGNSGTPGLLSPLTANVNRFEEHLFELVRDLLTSQAADRVVENLDNEMALAVQRLTRWQEQRNAFVRAFFKVPSPAELIEELDAVQWTFNNRAEYSEIRSGAFDFDANHARFSPSPRAHSRDRSLEDMVALENHRFGAARRVEAEAGDLVVLTVDPSDRWAPDCAARDAWLFDRPPRVQGPGIPAPAPQRRLFAPPAETDSAGFHVVYNNANQAAEVTTWSQAYSFSETDSYNECTHGSIGGFSILFISIPTFFSNQRCYTWQETNSESLQWARSVGFDQTTAMSFNSGLRLRDTPFEEAPAGSLIVFELPRSVSLASATQEDIITWQVVRPGTTTVQVERTSNLYFVVNDRGHCANQSSSAIQVGYRVLRPNGAYARGLAEGLVSVLEAVRNELPGLVERGEILNSDLQRIRTDAVADALAQTPGQPLSSWPELLQRFFERALERELARLSYRVRVTQLDHQIADQIRAIEALGVERGLASRSARAARLLPSMGLRRLDTYMLRSVTDNTVTYLKTAVYPVIRNWFSDNYTYTTAPAPGTTGCTGNTCSAGLLEHFQVAAGPYFDILRDRGPSSSILDYADSVKSIAETFALQRSLFNSYNNSVGQSVAPVILSYRRPGGVATGPFGQPIPLAYSPYRVVDSARAREVWDELDDLLPGQDARLTFRLSPEDLYEGLGLLSCDQNLPILRDVGVAFVRPTNLPATQPGQTTSPWSKNLTGRAGDSQPLVTLDGLEMLRLTDPGKRTLAGPVAYVHPGDMVTQPALQVMNALMGSTVNPNYSVAGISPLSELEIEIDSTHLDLGLRQDSVLSRVNELLLVLRVEFEQTPSPLRHVNQCLP